MAAARSLLFQLPRFVSRRLQGALYHRASGSPYAGLGQQQILGRRTAWATPLLPQVAAHSLGDAIVAASLRPREADVAAELLAVKGRLPSPAKPSGPGKPKENQPGADKHHDVPDKKPKEGKQGTGNNYAASS